MTDLCRIIQAVSPDVMKTAGFPDKLPAFSPTRQPMSDSGTGSSTDHGPVRATVSLALIFASRMLGLFMIYPVFAVYARDLPGATATTIGLALGIYGLAQALLQIPLGWLSDRVGRRPVIAGGLVVFALGSVVAALSGSIYGIIAGRLLQGTGAIGSVILALTADLTHDRHRTRAMAVIGMSIGLSFAVAVVVGPMLQARVGVPGIFWLTALLGLTGIGVLFLSVPRPREQRLHRDSEAVPALFWRVLSDRQLLRLDLGILVQHAILTATFLGLPVLLRDTVQLASGDQWLLYLPVLAVSLAVMVPLMIHGERRGQVKGVFLGAVAGIAVSQALLVPQHTSLMTLVPVIIVFFAAFNLLEATLPSLVSRVAPAGMKGTALGVYSSSQFLGIFLGGVLGGWIQQVWGLPGLHAFAAALATLWFLASLGLHNPGHMANRTVALEALAGREAGEICARLLRVPGVRDVAVAPEDETALIKVMTPELDERVLTAVLRAEEMPPDDATAH